MGYKEIFLGEIYCEHLLQHTLIGKINLSK